MNKIIACTLALLFGFVAFGNNQADSVQMYFRLNGAQFDPMQGDNAVSMDSFVEAVRTRLNTNDLIHVEISGYASPDGTARYNERLAERRCNAVAEEIIKRTGIPRELIHTQFGGIAWGRLRELVEETANVPARNEVLDILDNTPVWIFNSRQQMIGSRKKSLMDLRGGIPYRWMLKNLFPKLRYALVVSAYYKSDDNCNATGEVDDALTATEITDTASTATPPIQFLDIQVVTDSVTPADTVFTSQTVDNEINYTYVPRHLFALKSNLLYYGVLMPNIGLEWLINANWSLAVEGNVASWGHYSQNKSYRMAVIDGEVRRWLKPHAVWHGMYVGIIAGGGWYDLLNGSPGYYGEGLMVGLTSGYMWPISRNISLEAGIGAGYIYTRYKEYTPYEGHHLYQRTKELNYFGLIKLNFSIVWRFFDVNKPKRTKPEV